MEDDSAIEMFVGGLVLDPNTQAPVVVLKNEEGDIHLPIWIGVAEATSIASAIKELEMARPLTHDLLMMILEEASLRVERVVITELKDSTYFAELILSSGDKALILDSRPSDAIAVALRASAPIFVTQQVLAQAQITFAESAAGGEGQGEESGEKGPQDAGEQSGDAGGGEGASAELTEEEKQALEAKKALEEREAEAASPLKDFKDIDKDKWNEILSELDPEDFKYKT
ncbi:MAG: bifunctional nuclease family protein [Bdellovibrionales bacterium]|nr:bifunctional nuclease family protein [Bdellovibrionales bacterium]